MCVVRQIGLHVNSLKHGWCGYLVKRNDVISRSLCSTCAMIVLIFMITGMGLSENMGNLSNSNGLSQFSYLQKWF